MTNIKNIIIKRYPRDQRWYILDKDTGNTVCNIGVLGNIDVAIDWVNQHYPEANTEVVDQSKFDSPASVK